MSKFYIHSVLLQSCTLTTGHKKNIHFPFDTINDTAIEVAIEMVKELEISDLEPLDIAEMIEEEISTLVPTWKDYQPHHSFSYEEDHFFSSSSRSSSHGSLTMFSSSYNNNVHYCGNPYPEAQYCPQGTFLCSTYHASNNTSTLIQGLKLRLQLCYVQYSLIR